MFLGVLKERLSGAADRSLEHGDSAGGVIEDGGLLHGSNGANQVDVGALVQELGLGEDVEAVIAANCLSQSLSRVSFDGEHLFDGGLCASMS